MKNKINIFFTLSLIIKLLFLVDVKPNQLQIKDNVMPRTALIEKHNSFFEQRKLFIKNNLEKKLQKNIPLNKVPNIAICCSGGGFRSMLATTGLLSGMNNIGLLDVTSSIATLSGSSWAVAPWCLQEISINEYKEKLIEKCNDFYELKKIVNIPKNLDVIKKLIKDTYSEFTKTKKTKKEHNQKTSFVDTYGIMLSHFLLKEFGFEKFNKKLSGLSSSLYNLNLPFPIFTTVTQLTDKQYEWLEFTPFYVGAKKLDFFIEPNNLGKIFNNGTIEKDAPETNLSTLLGIFGSAFSTSLRDSINKLSILRIPTMMENFLHKTEHKIEDLGWANKKISCARIPNYTFNMPNSPIKDKEDLIVIDGGYLCNLPIIPLLEQEEKMDIIIVLDNSNYKLVRDTHNLQIAENTAKEKGYKFPPIDYEKAKTQNLSIFKDENDPECPVIIYIPLITNSDYSRRFNPQKSHFCRTTNFFYSKKEAESLSGLTEYTIQQYEKEIWDIIIARL